MLMSIGVVFVALFLLYKCLDAFLRRPVLGCGDRTILVTGCDTGFGRELARRLDGKGCHVFATCTTSQGRDDLERGSTTGRLKAIILDVSDEEAVKEAYEYVKKHLPSGKGLWGLVNNAGTPGKAIGPMEWLTIDNYRDIYAVNLLGLIDVTITFLPLIKKEKGRVVNMASVHGRTCLHGNVPYSCTKYGVEAFSDALRRQLLVFGCKVSIIEPGFHKTNIINRNDNEMQLRVAWQQASAETKEEYGDKYLEKAIDSYLNELIPTIASNRISDVIDAYEHALFAVRPRARYVIGFDANYFWLPVQSLPEWLGDWIQEVLTPKAPVPAASIWNR